MQCNICWDDVLPQEPEADSAGEAAAGGGVGAAETAVVDMELEAAAPEPEAAPDGDGIAVPSSDGHEAALGTSDGAAPADGSGEGAAAVAGAAGAAAAPSWREDAAELPLQAFDFIQPCLKLRQGFMKGLLNNTDRKVLLVLREPQLSCNCMPVVLTACTAAVVAVASQALHVRRALRRRRGRFLQRHVRSLSRV